MVIWSSGSRAASGPTSGTRPPTGIAKITIDRPEVRNAFRPLTTRELIDAFELARDDPTIGVVILTGEGPGRVLARVATRRSAATTGTSTSRGSGG